MIFTFPNSSYSNLANNGDGYLPIFGQNTVNNVLAAAYAETAIIIPSGFSGIIDRLDVKTEAAIGTGSMKMTLYRNGTSTALSATVTGGSQTATDTTNSVTMNAGDTFALFCQNLATGATHYFEGYSLRFKSNTPKYFILGGTGGSITNHSETTYQYNYFTNPALLMDATLSNRDEFSPLSCTLRGVVFNYTAPGDIPFDTLRVQLYKNGAAVSGVTGTLAGGGTGILELTGLSVSIAAGDRLSWGLRLEPADGIEGSSFNICNLIESGTDGSWWIGGATSANLDTANTAYNPMDANEETWRTTEIRNQYCGTAFTLTNMRAFLTGTPGASKSYKFLVRNNGSDGNLNVLISGSVNTSGSDLTNSDSILSGSTLLMKCVPTATPTARDGRWCAVGSITSNVTNEQINIADVWKTVNSEQINIGDRWCGVVSKQINIGDAWKYIYV